MNTSYCCAKNMPIWCEQQKFLSRLEKSIVRQLADASVVRSYGKGEALYHQGADAQHLYFLVSGFVQLSVLTEDSFNFTHAVFGPGETCGELGVFQNSHHADTANALSPTVVYQIRRDLLNSIACSNMMASDALAWLVAQRYRCYMEATRCLMANSMTARLAYALLRIARQIGQQAVIDGRKVEIIGSCITQSVIGSMARCTRSNVNRRLKKWEQCGIIKIRNRSIYVIDRDWLSSLISS